MGKYLLFHRHHVVCILLQSVLLSGFQKQASLVFENQAPAFRLCDCLPDFEAVGFFHGEHPGVMYSHRKRLIRKMRVVV